MCQALSEELQPHRRGNSCPGSELKGLASRSQLIGLFLRAQTVVSGEEGETPASLGVWIPTNFILVSAGTNWHGYHFSTPSQTYSSPSILRGRQPESPMHPFPGHRAGADATASPSQTRCWNKGSGLWRTRRHPASLHGALPPATPPSPAQMLSMEMKPSSFQSPSCFQ